MTYFVHFFLTIPGILMPSIKIGSMVIFGLLTCRSAEISDPTVRNKVREAIHRRKKYILWTFALVKWSKLSDMGSRPKCGKVHFQTYCNSILQKHLIHQDEKCNNSFASVCSSMIWMCHFLNVKESVTPNPRQYGPRFNFVTIPALHPFSWPPPLPLLLATGSNWALSFMKVTCR